MKKSIKEYLNIYVVLGLIGVASVLYIFSFAFLFNDIAGSSSREIKKKYCEKNPQECNISIKRNKSEKI